MVGEDVVPQPQPLCPVQHLTECRGHQWPRIVLQRAGRGLVVCVMCSYGKLRDAYVNGTLFTFLIFE